MVNQWSTIVRVLWQCYPTPSRPKGMADSLQSFNVSTTCTSVQSPMSHTLRVNNFQYRGHSTLALCPFQNITLMYEFYDSSSVSMNRFQAIDACSSVSPFIFWKSSSTITGRWTRAQISFWHIRSRTRNSLRWQLKAASTSLTILDKFRNNYGWTTWSYSLHRIISCPTTQCFRVITRWSVEGHLLRSIRIQRTRTWKVPFIRS